MKDIDSTTFESIVKNSMVKRFKKMKLQVARELGKLIDKKNKEKEMTKYILLSTKTRKYEIESQQDIDDLYAYGVITFAEKTEVEQRLNDWLHNETYDLPIERCKKEMEMIDRYIIWLE